MVAQNSMFTCPRDVNVRHRKWSGPVLVSTFTRGLMEEEKTQKLYLCGKAAIKKKAFDLLVLDIRETSSFADYFILCSGNSNRQVQAIASAIELDLKEKGIYHLGIEGFNEGT